MRDLSRHLIRSAVVGLLALGFASVAQAVPITTLYNTGVDAGGAVLPDGTIGDPHYSLIGVPGGTSTIRVITSASGFPIPPYVGDNASSRWIGPNNDADLNGPGGWYTYRTTFDLTGLDPLTAFISGLWSSDNGGVQIDINGVNSGNPGTGSTAYAGWAPFTVASGFIAGLNTLDFIVNNEGGPTALRTELSGSADSLTQPPGPGPSVPEPASIVLFGTGIIAGMRRFRIRTSRTNG